MSIGSLKEKFNPLKIKDLVDLAGLSQSPPPLNLNPPLIPEECQDSLNNNSSIVTELLEIWDALEVGHQLPSTIWLEPEFVKHPVIPMKLETDLAEKAVALTTLSELMDTELFPEDPPQLLNLLVTHTQFQYVLTLLHGLVTEVVS